MKVIGNLTKDAIIRAAVSEGLTVSQVIGTSVVFEDGTSGISVLGEGSVYDTNAQKVVISYKDGGNSGYGTSVVGTVSGNSISFGTPVVFNSGDTDYISAAYDSNAQKVVVVYTDYGDSTKGKAIVGTVSGTSISFGTAVVYESSSNNEWNTIVYDSNAQKVAVAYASSSTNGLCKVGTVSGTSISFGSSTTFNSGDTNFTSSTFDSTNNKIIIAYEDNSNGGYGTAIVGTISGTSISFGSEVVFESADTRSISATYDTQNEKVVIAYEDDANSDYGNAVVGTVSGTSISFGTPVVFEEASVNNIAAVYDVNAQKIVIIYKDVGNGSQGTVIEGTVSGTSISFGTAAVFEAGGATFNNAVYDPNEKKIVFSYQDGNNSSRGTALVFQTGYTAATGGTIADGSAVVVNANGTVSTVSQEASSAGTAAVYNSGSTGRSAVGYDPVNKKIVIVYQDAGNSNYGTAIVGTVDASNKSISFGSEVVFESASSDHFAIAFDTSAQKFLIVYEDSGNSSYGTGIVGTVSGTSISFGTPTVFASKNPTIRIATDFDTNAGKFLVCFADGQNSYAAS